MNSVRTATTANPAAAKTAALNWATEAIEGTPGRAKSSPKPKFYNAGRFRIAEILSNTGTPRPG